MIFLADILTDGTFYNKTDKTKKESSVTTKARRKNSKKKKNKPIKQKKSTFTRLVNKTAGVTSFTQGEIAVVKSMVANDVKTSLNNQKSKQKTIGAKKSTSFHRKEK